MQEPPWAKRIYLALRKHQPHSLRAHLADESIETIKISANVRQKWAPTIKLLGSLPWVKLDLLDAKGRLQHTELADAAGDAEDIGAGPTHSNFYREVRAQTALMLQAQGAAMEMIKPILGGYERVLHDTFEMARQYREESEERGEQLAQLAGSVDKAIAANAAGDDDATMKQVLGVIDIMQKVNSMGGIGGLFGGPRRMPARPAAGARPAGANGANGKPAGS